jgi:hypothetical protein
VSSLSRSGFFLSGELLMSSPAELEKQAVEAEDKSNGKSSN